jgi:hypothetical protein
MKAAPKSFNGAADMAVAGFGGKPASRKVATLARSRVLGDAESGKNSLLRRCPVRRNPNRISSAVPPAVHT